ncbi:MAG: NADH:ubiquinone reductase (Na(+)-transporting) subunit C [Bacteroidales bacterium]|jgi:Na+-transporting NADH:ubiquinone oxidoreductase subunit C|nr:NADH:ubiquinone reductase (Na(+)-transporting) subunit C [Bacteroidales bacterium]
MFSNRYIYIYSIILVVCAAAILTFAAVGLKPMQDRNVRVEKMQQLLDAVGISSTTKDAQEKFDEYFTEQYAVNLKGEVVGKIVNGKQILGKVNPFSLDEKKQFSLAKNKDENALLPIYICTKQGKKQYVIPVRGNGLWGAIWGNIALDEDLKTVVGVNFSHKGETPGLGAEITTDNFKNQFKGKTIFDGDKFTSISVIKRADKANLHQVDAISGGTMTSNGVSDMLKDCLGYYIPYFNSVKK